MTSIVYFVFVYCGDYEFIGYFLICELSASRFLVD